jgi:hypothetical protein
MRSHTSRGVFPRMLVLVLAMFLQVGPFVSPAFALSAPFKCERWFEGEEWEDEYGLIWRCEEKVPNSNIWEWDPVRTVDGVMKKGERVFRTRNPISYQIVSSSLWPGSGGGITEGHQALRSASLNPMSRPMRTRVVIKYYRPAGGWFVCHDTKWINNGIRQWSHNAINMDSSPDCGRALYGAKTAALFWSHSLGRWLGGTWVLSGNLSLPPDCCAHENPPPMSDTPLDLPPLQHWRSCLILMTACHGK